MRVIFCDCNIWRQIWSWFGKVEGKGGGRAREELKFWDAEVDRRCVGGI